MKFDIGPRSFVPATSNGAAWKSVDGSNFPVEGWAFDASTQETIYARIPALGYTTGNPTFTLSWYTPGGATSGGVTFGISFAAITANTDSQDVETKAFATEVTGSDTHLGTTSKRLHNFTIAVSNLDSLAADDELWIRVRRVPADASDTMSGDCVLTGITCEWS